MASITLNAVPFSRGHENYARVKTGSQFGSSLASLRSKPADEILKESQSISFPPNVDGWLLPADVYTIFAQGKQSDMPLLLGPTRMRAGL